MTDPGVEAMAKLHDVSDVTFLHDDLDSTKCGCRPSTVVASFGAGVVVSAPPNMTGDTCLTCGGMTVRTGTCSTCTSCGTTGGCG